MAGEWSKVRIADLGLVMTGRTPPGNAPTYYDGDVQFLTPSDMVGRRRVERTARSLSPYGAKQLARCLVPHGVGVSCIGWQMGKAVLIDRPTVTNQQINSVVVSENVADCSFVYYSFLARREELFNLGAGGSRTPILNKGDFERLPFILPPLPEQRAIAYILGTLDDKIELNQRMNETLEAMARALFKSWFVDFDPVRAKAESRDSGLPTPFDDLFPDSFEDSELGEIPKGWRAASFGEAASLQRDTVNPLDTPDAEFFHFSIPAYDEGGTPKRELGASIKSLKFRVPDDGILFSKLNPSIERVWFVDSPTKATAVCSTEFLVFRARPPFTRAFVYSLARSTNFRLAIQSSVTGTSNSHQRTQPDSVLSILSPLPSRHIIDAFEKIVAPLLHDIQIKNRESRTLVALRDTLLPKLISGELRIDAAERFIKERTI